MLCEVRRRPMCGIGQFHQMVKPPPVRPQNYLLAWREHRHMTQAKVAEALNRSHTTIGRWEKGPMKLSEENLRRLAELYNVKPNQLRFPVDEAKFVERLDRVQDIIHGMDDNDFEVFMNVAERFRKPPPAN